MKTEKIMQHLIGKTYQEVLDGLSIKKDDGMCCGCAECDVSDFVKQIQDAKNAKLVDAIKFDYADELFGESRVVVNFIFDVGDNKGVVLGYDLKAGSESGFMYGAVCDLFYKDELVASASY